MMNTLATHRAGTRKKMAATLIAGCLIGALSMEAANAATPGEAPSIAVKFDARSLATDSGARALYQRLVRVARQVCPDASDRSLESFAAARRCQREAVARAVRDIDSPRLAEVYAVSVKRG